MDFARIYKIVFSFCFCILCSMGMSFNDPVEYKYAFFEKEREKERSFFPNIYGRNIVQFFFIIVSPASSRACVRYIFLLIFL